MIDECPKSPFCIKSDNGQGVDHHELLMLGADGVLDFIPVNEFNFALFFSSSFSKFHMTVASCED